MRLLLAFAVASITTLGCSGGASSPTGPSPVSSVNGVQSARVTAVDENGNPVSGQVKFGDTIVLSLQGVSCEKPTNFYGSQYVRDDGSVLRPSSGYSCAFVGQGGTAEPRDTLESRNDTWDFVKGHRVTIEFVIMETYPVPVYRKAVGELVFAN